MSIEQLDKIDSVIIDVNRGICQCVIVDHLQWDQQHLALLQRKINYYLQWIESGEIYLHYPQVTGNEFQIVVKAIFSPNDVAVAFVAQVSEILEASGFEFAVRPLASAYADAP